MLFLVENCEGNSYFDLTNNIPHVVCRYVCVQLFIRTCMPSSCESVIITIKSNTKDNF